MWPVENNAYTQWRLDYQVRPAKIDRLLNTVSTTDREGTIPWSRWFGRALAKLGKLASLRRHSPTPTDAMLGRPSL